MDSIDIKRIEVDALLDVINKRYGYDFSQYSRASLLRRIEHRRILAGVEHISDLIPRIIHDPEELDKFICDLSVTVTEMFRDPHVYVALKKLIFPILATYPRVKIWHAGCATGEEVYSMAIFLKEAGLYNHVQIYATDFNNHSLDIARKGIYSYKFIKKYTENYQKSEGCQSFSDYYHAKYDHVIMDESLKENIIFSNHNLVHDNSFGEMNLILCRNVLIYFNKKLQDRVFRLFDEGISSQGFICLGTKESMDFSSLTDRYAVFSKDEKIYRKKLDW